MRRYGFARAASTSASGWRAGSRRWRYVGCRVRHAHVPARDGHRRGRSGQHRSGRRALSTRRARRRSGVLCGASFGLLLVWVERRKPIAKLSVACAAIWGALGAVAFPVLDGMPNVANILMFVCPLPAALRFLICPQAGTRLRSLGMTSLYQQPCDSSTARPAAAPLGMTTPLDFGASARDDSACCGDRPVGDSSDRPRRPPGSSADARCPT